MSKKMVVFNGRFTRSDIANDPVDVGKAAAMYAVADSNGTAGVILFNDPIYAIANVKTNAWILKL
jgi:ribose transport system substrate-binding protein